MKKMEGELSAKAREAGDTFLAENAKKDGVVVLESGLQYEVITEGSGALPTLASTVRTHYHGTFADGRVFDSSVERGEPAEFPVGGVIAGWTEALQLMKEGSKWRLYVPSDLAYGEQGSQGAIPPHCALVFEVELLNVVS
jgi:FKBP-type peptidyl-prolyl cis-trans isomerase FklB